MDRIRISVIACLTLVMAVLLAITPPAAWSVDEAKIPHYFGPAPNWALSPLPAVNPDGSISGGIRKFVDGLPLLGPAGANNLGQYIPVAVPDTTTYPGSDYYEIAVVQYREKMHSDLPPTLLRGYVQLGTGVVSGRTPLTNALVDGTTVPIAGFTGVAPPHYLGPVIVATKDRPVRILFRNLLPAGSGGDLFLPVDSTLMGSGVGSGDMGTAMNDGTVTDMVRNPVCSQFPKPDECFSDNRATLHLHGGITPWISDGTPHQWVTPADETTPWPKGVSVRNVPDMPDPGPGAMTFFYTNQQSARLMFYHDHSWGITRLNVYAGEAAGYVITDNTEKKLLPATAANPGGLGLIPGPADTIPLIIQDRTFVPPGDKATRTGQLYELDPTWDEARWGGFGNLWYHHVYMPAQNPGDPGGMSAYGRWMYGPWFWPPATDTVYGPIRNPRHDMDPATSFTTPLQVPCDIEDPATWQYQVDPFCEPEYIPGTPNISAGMEQFNDTPLVNGTAYPTTTVEPKPYRLRILNAANDRFFNLQMYVADQTGTEVALKADEVAAAQDDPVVFPTPDTSRSPVGPSWIVIGNEGGFLPAPVVVPNQHTTWITDPTRFDVGNVDKHSLLLAPAERADVIVDFSQYAGKTLILYNDAPAAFPARVPTYDYYTGYPDQSPSGPSQVLPGYGPNTRTVMQIRVAASSPAPPFNLPALQAAFRHQDDGSGVFESGQHPIIVGQAAYNAAYGTNFSAASWCNAPGSTKTRCDGLLRISEQGGDLFGFNSLFNPLLKLQIPIEPKAIHDEMNSVSFDEFGRMSANLGVENSPATPGNQNVTLYPYVNPVTEIINGTSLPRNGVNIAPISAQDGTQIWKITHNGVDTHPIHFHLYDVQVLNRVTWDNIVMPPHPTELGWKETVRISPLQDTIVALRPVIPTLPFELPNSIRLLNPMMPQGSAVGFNNVDMQGEPTAGVTNQLANFGWEYVYHCHILSHEEMDMMRPLSVALPPRQPDGLSASITQDGAEFSLVLSWNDNSINETEYVVQKTTDGNAWTDVGTSVSPLDQPNTTGVRTLVDPAVYTPHAGVTYRVVARNTVGYGAGFPSLTVTSVSDPLRVTMPDATPPPSPTDVMAVAGDSQAIISFTPPSTNGGSQILSYRITSTPGNITMTATASPMTFAGLTNGISYTFAVSAVNSIGTGPSAVSSPVTPATAPGAPTITAVAAGNAAATIAFTPPASDGGSPVTLYTVRSGDGGFTATGASSPITVAGLTNGASYTFTVTASNITGEGAPSAPSTAVVPATVPSAPVIGFATAGAAQASVTFSAPPSNGGSPVIDYTVTASPGGITATGTTSPIIVTGLGNAAYTFTVTANNALGTGPPSAATNSVTPYVVPGSPIIGTATAGNGQATVTFSPPVSDGGSAIIVYTVTSDTGVSAVGTASPITVTGLLNGVACTFTVTATNAAGAGTASAPSAAVIPATVPGAPTIGAVAAGNAAATIAFAAPASDGGSPVTLYTVSSGAGGITATGTSSPIVVTGLTNGVSYTFTVTASNVMGEGAPSAPSSGVVPATVPSAPVIGSAVAGAAQATVHFSVPASDGGRPVVDYTVTASPGGITATGTASPIIVSGLANAAYTFTVRANNAIGAGPPSAPTSSVTPYVVPDAPLIGTATAGNGNATVTFAPPASDGGSAIITYTVTSSTGISAAGTASPITVTGLANGIPCTFTVTATNAAGAGTASAQSVAVTPATVPGSPTIGTVAAGNAVATVAFTPPASNGGAPVTLYTVRSSVGGVTATGPSSPITVTGLTNGVSYTFTVTASNAMGEGATSAPSPDVVPATVPSAPAIGTVTAGSGQAIVAFTPPSSDGGRPVVLYTVTSNNGITAYGVASPITVTGLVNGTSYTFTVTATNVVGQGPASASSGSVVPASTLPAAPSRLAAALSPMTAAPPVVTLAWLDNSTDEAGFVVERATNSRFTADLVSFNTGRNVTTYTDAAATAGTRYYYRVRAVNVAGESTTSNVVNVTPRQLPADPSDPATAGATRSSLILTWADNSSNETGFYVQRSNSPNGPWSRVKTLPANTTTFTNTGLSRNRTYWYRVQAYNSDGTSGFTSAVSGTTLP